MLPTATGERILLSNRHEAGAAMTDEIHLRHLEEFAEAAYDKMYDAGSPSGATALYSDANGALHRPRPPARPRRRRDETREAARAHQGRVQVAVHLSSARPHGSTTTAAWANSFPLMLRCS